MIKHSAQQTPAQGFKNAKALLEKKYGNPYNIMTMHRKEIKIWPHVKNGDADRFQKFCNFLVKCESITQSSWWNPLDIPGLICMLVSKLTGNLRDKWVRLVMKVRRKEQGEATLCDFIEFISEEIMLVNDHLFSKEAIDNVMRRDQVDKKMQRKGVAPLLPV